MGDAPRRGRRAAAAPARGPRASGDAASRGSAAAEAIEARSRTGLSQEEFARLLGVSVRTLQDWEQGRREPTQAARMLLRVACTYPDVLLKLAR